MKSRNAGIPCIAGSPKGKNILKLDAFLEKNRDEETPPTRVKPITAKDIILTHYPYITGFSFDDVKQIFHKLNNLGQINSLNHCCWHGLPLYKHCQV